MGPIWVPFGQAHMGLPRYCLYGTNMGWPDMRLFHLKIAFIVLVSNIISDKSFSYTDIDLDHHKPYFSKVIPIWDQYGSYVGQPIWVSLYGAYMGPIWASPYGLAQVQPIWDPYRVACWAVTLSAIPDYCAYTRIVDSAMNMGLTPL